MEATNEGEAVLPDSKRSLEQEEKSKKRLKKVAMGRMVRIIWCDCYCSEILTFTNELKIKKVTPEKVSVSSYNFFLFPSVLAA
jgi:hypothetical protein